MSNPSEGTWTAVRPFLRNARLLAFASAGALALSGCVGTSTPDVVPGQAQDITAEEQQYGAQAHPQLLAEFGGVYDGPGAEYVRQVGQNIAVQSGLANAQNAYTVTLLNSPVNNAFAVPGGYIYTTRALVGLMDNEAELAAVLGHEVGHVAARHSQQRQKATQQNSILGALGSVLSGVLFGNTALGQLGQQVASSGSQLLTLKYSRSQERQADDLAIAYLSAAGYEPRAMASVLRSLAEQNALDARLSGREDTLVPEWASTHPDPASRVNDALAEAQGVPGSVTNRDVFLSRIDGMLYGDDPQQGVVNGSTFIHPVFGFQFRAPDGYFMVNGTRAVTITGQSGKAQLTTRPYSGDLSNYIRAAFSDLTGEGQQNIAPQTIQNTTVNGLNAAYGQATVNNGQSNVEVTVFAYETSNNQAFHFITIAPVGGTNTFNPMFNSFRRISSAEAAAVKARRVDVVTVRSGDTIRSLANRMAYDNYQLERFLVLNSLDANATLQAGKKVKIITY